MLRHTRGLIGLSSVLVMACLVVGGAVFGQTGTAGITGVVSDPQGRVVDGAKVTMTNLGINATRDAVTTDEGAYIFDLLPPVEYRLEVEAPGFRKSVFDHAQALIGKQTEINIRLDIGQVNQVVEVSISGQNAQINTQDASLGNVYDSTQITQLPLEGRSLVDLLSLQPGSTREGYVTGARADQSNITLDGVDINNAQTGNTAVPATGNSLVIGGLDTDRGNITSGP